MFKQSKLTELFRSQTNQALSAADVSIYKKKYSEAGFIDFDFKMGFTAKQLAEHGADAMIKILSRIIINIVYDLHNDLSYIKKRVKPFYEMYIEEEPKIENDETGLYKATCKFSSKIISLPLMENVGSLAEVC